MLGAAGSLRYCQVGQLLGEKSKTASPAHRLGGRTYTRVYSRRGDPPRVRDGGAGAKAGPSVCPASTELDGDRTNVRQRRAEERIGLERVKPGRTGTVPALRR